jgi:RNA recognition motif-containing protein
MSSNLNSSPEHMRSLFLGNLPYDCTEQDIFCLFRDYGEISSIRMMKEHESSLQCLGYGFITFMDCQSSIVAKDTLNGRLFLGRPLRY